MTSIHTIIKGCTDALAAVTPDNLTDEQIVSSLSILRSFNVNDAVDDYWESLPEKPDNITELSDWETENHQRGKAMNHELKLFNDELTRIKNMHAALNLPQLEDIIHAAQDVIRPLYNFSAHLTA